ncbi:MAG: hypothetical protein DHS20C15_05890 [Planctomycetota bacterium]|nr:MAG: hypothetical protein DHS20C15_05890 [Planctomycetota bacterium]
MTISRATTPRLLGAPISTVSWFVLFLVCIDAFATTRLMGLSVAREVNPAMGWLLDTTGPQLFALIKIGLTGLCLLWINKRAPLQHARVAALVAVTIYLPVVGVHAITTKAVMG